MPLEPFDSLRDRLRRIDGRSYSAYRELRGGFESGGLELHVDAVQGDPFAAPSRVRVRIDQREAGLPPEWFGSRVRRIALEDLLARRARRAIRREVAGSRGSGRSGEVACDAGGQQILERSAARVNERFAELRLRVGLPAAGRRVRGRDAEALLCEELVRVAERALIFDDSPEGWAEEARDFIACAENHAHLQRELAARGLVAFVANGAVLPRRSGVDDRPLEGSDAVPFVSPESLRVTLPVPHAVDGAREVTGMGIAKGVTLIVGGGYHGKSTLLAALERGVYPHVPGDGRERVVADAGLVKIRAEDGRSVAGVDIRGFIGTLPGGRATGRFSSEDASGSTSQAASLVEALEAGATGLLLDEDTCATNFMVRDERMRALVPDDEEPITPFRERIRELHASRGVSTVLVMGGVGDYFSVADTVVRMADYGAADVTDEARRIARENAPATREPLPKPPGRTPAPESIDASRGRRAVKVAARTKRLLSFGREEIDLHALEQLVDASQTRAIGHALHRLATRHLGDGRTLAEALDALDAELDEAGVDRLGSERGEHPGELARPRRMEIAAALNRLRTLRLRDG